MIADQSSNNNGNGEQEYARVKLALESVLIYGSASKFNYVPYS